jgi:hypothetical protein
MTDFDIVPTPVFSFKTKICHHSPARDTTAAALIRVEMCSGVPLEDHCYSCVFPPHLMISCAHLVFIADLYKLKIMDFDSPCVAYQS